MTERRLIIGGNWKMHKTPSEGVHAAKALRVKLINVSTVDVVICPPATGLVPIHAILRESNIKIGAQNLYWEDEGAFTGEISAPMLRDAGCDYVIVGHSERRHVFGESDDQLNKKVKKAMSAGLKVIFCVGETLAERNNGEMQTVVKKQIQLGLDGLTPAGSRDLVIAYEPVWAIGTGVTASPTQAEEMHGFVRHLLAKQFDETTASQIQIQYGGSVKPANADELLSQENIDGALVGGASLDPESFTAIVKAAEKITN